ncbi:MAG: IMP dehydrogenase [Dysosmobacter welbionis]
MSFVFRKDYDSTRATPGAAGQSEAVCGGRRHQLPDYEERVPALVEAGADVLVIDSSRATPVAEADPGLIRSRYGDTVKVGAGNVVDGEGFRFLADCGADFEGGIGGGSICITRETKGIGRARPRRSSMWRQSGTGILPRPASTCPSVPTAALSRTTTSPWPGHGRGLLYAGAVFLPVRRVPTSKVLIGGSYMEEYWGEGSARARNWQRYDLGGAAKLSFEEGVDSYVPYAGKLSDGMAPPFQGAVHHVQLRALTIRNCGRRPS